MLDKIVENLESARSRIEAKFGEAGGFLQETLRRIENQLEVLAELGKALDPQSVGSATQDLRATAEALFAVPANLEARHKKLQSLRRQGTDLRKNISEIQGLLRYLRAFAFNVKITAAGMGAQSQQFSSFSSEMETRIEYGEKQIAQFCLGLGNLERYIDSALASEAKLANETRSMLPAVPQGLANDADAVDTFHARTAENAVNVRNLAQRIQNCILSALSTLQVGDNVRQRIEHVQTALASLTELDAKLAGENVDEAERRKLRSFVCAMLAAQLEDMSDVFATEATRMMDLMGQIAVDSHVMAEALEFGRHDGRDGGLRSLEQSVAQALVLVNDMEEASEHADTLHKATSEAVQDLVERVNSLRDVKDDVQYMALNTSLRCVHIGDEGRPLQVVASELSAYAKQLGAAAATTLASVEALAEVNGTDAAAADAERSFRTRLEAAVACLCAAADVAEKDVSSAAGQGRELAAKLGNIEEKLNFKADLVDVMQNSAAALAEMAGEVPTDLDAIESPLGEIMAAIAKTYTMAREREVHVQFMPGDEPEPAASTSADDDFEMFA